MAGRNPLLIERDGLMAELAQQGLSRTAIADQLGVALCVVDAWIRATGTKLVRAHRNSSAPVGHQDPERTEKMAAMYRQGITLRKIGLQFGLTRERVRQLIAKMGLNAQSGGQRIVADAKKAAKRQAQETASLAKYGLPLAVVRQLRRDGVTSAYWSQVGNSKKRGIRFDLTFAQWFSVWQASGKLHLRGRGKGKYVMSRVSDTGGYELGNVHIQLATENSREAVEVWRGKTKTNRGVFCLYPGRSLAWMAKVGRKSLGFYVSEADAIAARNAYLAAHPEVAGVLRGRGYSHIKGQNGRADRYQVMVGRKYVGSFLTADEALRARATFLSHVPVQIVGADSAPLTAEKASA